MAVAAAAVKALPIGADAVAVAVVDQGTAAEVVGGDVAAVEPAAVDLAFRTEYVHQTQAVAVVAVHAAYSANESPLFVQHLHSFAH